MILSVKRFHLSFMYSIEHSHLSGVQIRCKDSSSKLFLSCYDDLLSQFNKPPDGWFDILRVGIGIL